MSRLKKFLRRIPYLSKIKNGVFAAWIKAYGDRNPEGLTKRTYKQRFGKSLDLDVPKTLNEKLNYLKLKVYWDDPVVSVCADKYRVREYITEKGCPEILNRLLGCWGKAADIDWDALPEKFAIKCNHGSGFNLLCTDKVSFDRKKASETLDRWLKIQYGGNKICEQGIYRNIKPLIIAEAYIDTQDGLPPKDYKFFCSKGKCKFLFVASDRVDNRTKFDYYWPDWTWIPVKNAHPNAGPQPKPSNLDEMIRYAEKLSGDFPLVRVDLYEESGRIIFGELTFTHFGCIHKFEPDEYDRVFGDCFPDKLELTMDKCRGK